MSDTTETSEGSGFSAEERAAMKQRAEELRSMKGVKGAAKQAREFDACIAAIDALTGTDRAVAERLHVIVTEEAPELEPKTWYGFPSYARNGEVLVFLQPAAKFSTRYATIGFNDIAALDDGDMWATSFAVAGMTSAAEERLRGLVRRAAASLTVD